ncbi:hypothetical protein QFC20_003542 [Naganishia adeliensis]|uniref:Uncharacterized protein n=1 Tax=Naganishia adeliensis TaxID=92952 RepID=A0ACC2WAP0_9TREE|nr:hypothetical protein QFC20_003542 [Naganishia adeliensis]
MDRLPAEIIELISFDLRREHTPLGPKFEISELLKCLCNTINAQSNAEREECLGDRSFLESKDGAFAFSMTCKRIRAIVFKGRRDRRRPFEMPGKCEGTYVLPGFPFADEWSDILGHLNLPQLSSLKIQLEFGNYDFPDNEECWNVIVKGFKNVNRFPALKDVTLQLKFGVTPESRTDHWKQLCAIGKDILQSRQIDYLDIVVDFFVSPSWTNRRSFFAPLNDGATVLEHMFFPEDNDMKQIVDGLLAIHPSLKIFTLDIYGPTEGIEPGPRGKA